MSRWWCALLGVGLLALPHFEPASAATPVEEDQRTATLDPPNPAPSADVLVRLTGWPGTCAVVDLDYVDGSLGNPEDGEVLGSWGSVELTDGEGSKMVTAPGAGSPGEYNLRVTGDAALCGAPYFTPDWGITIPRPPQPIGRVFDRYDPTDPDTGIRIEAEGWGGCPALEVRLERLGVTVELGTLLLESGQGTLTAPPSVLLAFTPPDRYDDEDRDFWLDLIAEGPADRCGGPFQTEFGFKTPWPPASPAPTTTVLTATTVSLTPQSPGDQFQSGGELPDTGTNGSILLIAAVAVLVGAAALITSRRATPRSGPSH